MFLSSLWVFTGQFSFLLLRKSYNLQTQVCQGCVLQLLEAIATLFCSFSQNKPSLLYGDASLAGMHVKYVILSWLSWWVVAYTSVTWDGRPFCIRGSYVTKWKWDDHHHQWACLLDRSSILLAAHDWSTDKTLPEILWSAKCWMSFQKLLETVHFHNRCVFWDVI